MTIREFIQAAAQYPLLLSALCVLPPFLAWLCGVLHRKDRGAAPPWKYFYSVLVYLACVPGLFSVVLTVYTLFFRRENLLDVNLTVYFAPIVSMVLTLVIIRRNVSFRDVPGFGRLSGLMVMIGCSFAVALAVDRMGIWIWFGGSMGQLFFLALAVFALLMWGSRLLFRR